jgi:hypothetical protein
VLPVGLQIYGAVAANMEDAPWRLVYPPLLILAIATAAAKDAPAPRVAAEVRRPIARAVACFRASAQDFGIT